MTDLTPETVAKLMAEVTPGPWEAEPGHEQQNGQRYWQVQNEHDAIVQNQYCWAQGSHEANARLIAIAPDLAAAYIAQAARIVELEAQLTQSRAVEDDLAGLLDKAINGIWHHATHYEAAKEALAKTKQRAKGQEAPEPWISIRDGEVVGTPLGPEIPDGKYIRCAALASHAKRKEGR